MTEKEIEISVEFVNKVEKILRNYKESKVHE